MISSRSPQQSDFTPPLFQVEREKLWWIKWMIVPPGVYYHRCSGVSRILGDHYREESSLYLTGPSVPGPTQHASEPLKGPFFRCRTRVERSHDVIFIGSRWTRNEVTVTSATISHPCTVRVTKCRHGNNVPSTWAWSLQKGFVLAVALMKLRFPSSYDLGPCCWVGSPSTSCALLGEFESGHVSLQYLAGSPRDPPRAVLQDTAAANTRRIFFI